MTKGIIFSVTSGDTPAPRPIGDLADDLKRANADLKAAEESKTEIDEQIRCLRLRIASLQAGIDSAVQEMVDQAPEETPWTAPKPEPVFVPSSPRDRMLAYG